jgi:hypothetical protein
VKASFKIENPEDVDCTLTLTMKVRDWEDLCRCVSSEWPGWKVRGIVRDLVAEARKSVYPPRSEVPD